MLFQKLPGRSGRGACRLVSLLYVFCLLNGGAGRSHCSFWTGRMLGPLMTRVGRLHVGTSAVLLLCGFVAKEGQGVNWAFGAVRVWHAACG